MRKHIFALFGFLCGVLVYYIKAPVQDQAALQDEYHQQAFVVTTQAAPKKDENRTPAVVVPVATQKADISKEELQDYPGLPRGMKLAPFVRAVAAESYQEDMGDKLLEKNGFVFYHSENSGEANVVYDRRLDTFHPLTATIKLTGVSEAVRDEVLRQWEEFHYNQELGVQYVQSTHEGLLKDFEELKKNGFKASLEIIQAVYQTR